MWALSVVATQTEPPPAASSGPPSDEGNSKVWTILLVAGSIRTTRNGYLP